MNAGQHIDGTLDIAERAVIAAVRSCAAKDEIADDALFQIVPGTGERFGLDGAHGERIGNQLGEGLFLQLRGRFSAGLLALVCLADLNSSSETWLLGGHRRWCLPSR